MKRLVWPVHDVKASHIKNSKPTSYVLRVTVKSKYCMSLT